MYLISRRLCAGVFVRYQRTSFNGVHVLPLRIGCACTLDVIARGVSSVAVRRSLCSEKKNPMNGRRPVQWRNVTALCTNPPPILKINTQLFASLASPVTPRYKGLDA